MRGKRRGDETETIDFHFHVGFVQIEPVSNSKTCNIFYQPRKLDESRLQIAALHLR